jgi:hypothetical protein
MVERIDIERALNDLVSNEGGMKFQGLAVVLAKLRWPELIASERHNDLGLDAYAAASLAPDGRGKGVACSTTGSFEKLNADANEAQKHYSDVSILIFYTTQKVSQPKKAKWAEKIRQVYGYELTVFSREEIIASLQLPDNASLCRSHLKIPVPYQASITDLRTQAHEASSAGAAAWAAHPRTAGKPRIVLNAVALDGKGNETREVFTTPYLRELLLRGRRLILEAPAGRGKTTTLIQMAEQGNGLEGIPLLVDLPSWIRSSLGILDYIARMPEFLARGVDASGLARLSQAEPFLFLLNGWNEISNLYSQDAVGALHELQRSFPTAGIIVATRAHDKVPELPGSTRIRLLPLTPAQRLHYLEHAIGASGAQQLQVKLYSDRALDDLTRTPLILSEVTTIFKSGAEIPRTKLRLLGAVVHLMEQSEAHSSYLKDQPLWGRAEDYLRALAIRVTSRGDVLFGEEEARTICHSVSESLRNNKQIQTLPEPADVLNTLCKHHILEQLDYPTTNFRFEHQQFQEYYATLMLKGALAGIVATGDDAQRKTFARRYVNTPAWDEPLRMLAEDLGEASVALRDDAHLVSSSELLIGMALECDPVFAAELSYLCGPLVWKTVGTNLGHRFRALYASDNPPYRSIALAAMLATGSDDFTDILVPLLTNTDQQVRLATYRVGPACHPSSLGSQWQQIVESWPEEMRAEFVSELTTHHGLAEVASVFARSDPSADVKIEAIRDLGWIGQHHEVAELLQAMTDTEFGQALRKLYREEIPPKLQSRAISAYKDLLADTPDPKARVGIVLSLAQLGDADSASTMKGELANLPPEAVTALSDYSLRPAVELVRKVDSQWVSHWVAARIIEGSLWRDSWLPQVSDIPESLREDLLRRVSNENLNHRTSAPIISVLATTASPAHASAFFTKLCGHRRQLLADPQNQDTQAIDTQLRHLFRSVPQMVAVQGLSDMLSKAPEDFQLSLVTEMFSRMGSLEDSLKGALPETERQQLRRYLKAAVQGVIQQEDFRGEASARLATALAEVSDPEDVSDLLKLTRADIERVRQGRAAWIQGDRSAKGQGGMMSYSNWHVRALVTLDLSASEPALIDLLDEPEYELDAGWALVSIAKKVPGDPPIVAGWAAARDYRTLRRVAADWSAIYDEPRRAKFAAAVKKRIAGLREESATGDHKTIPYNRRLKELAKVLAALDPEHSADVILEIAGLPAQFDGWMRVELLESLLFSGVPLPANTAIAILTPVTAEVRSHGAHNNSPLKRLLCILPYVSPSAPGIAQFRELLSEFRVPLHDQRDLFMALGQCGSDEGIVFLRDFASQSAATFEHVAKEWVDAVAASPQPTAKPLLLSCIDATVSDGVGELDFPDYVADFLASRLSDLTRADSSLVERVLQLTTQPLSLKRRHVLAKVIARLDSPQSLLLGLNLLDDQSPQPIPYDLWKAIESFFLEKRPYKGDPQSYTLVPRAANDIRKRLFEMAENDSRRTRSAYSLLGQIEEWRLEYGRPSSEPRHPAYDSGKPWPPSISTGGAS